MLRGLCLLVLLIALSVLGQGLAIKQDYSHTLSLDKRAIFNPPANLYWPSGGDARCVNLTDVPILYPGVIIPPVCFDYILWPNSVYVDNNTYVRNLLGRTGMGGTWTSPDCLLSGYLQWCTLMFRPCYDVPIPAGYGNGTIAVGQYPCRYYCTFSRTACYGAIVDSVKATPGYSEQDLLDILNCDPPWSVLYGVAPPGVDIFPNGTYTAPVSADGGASYFNVSFPCYDGNINVTTPPPDALCPQGMYFFEGVCYFNCPEPIITDSEYDAITTMLSVMGWISLVSAAFLAITFLMDPEKRKFPANLSIFFILCIMCLSFSFCIGSMAGWRNVWCDDNDRPNTFGGPACTIQGIIFVYFTLASVLWWLVLSVNLLLMVTKVQPNNLTLRWMDYFRGLRTGWRGWLRWETVFIGYHMFAWLPPFISLIISLGAERLGFLGHDLWCTIHSGDPVRFVVDETGQVGYEGGDPANIWNLILLTIPILSTVALGICILIFVVIWSIWKIGWRFFYQQWRLFFFIMFFIWIYTFVFSFQIHLAVQADKQYQAYTEYINCKNYQYILEAAGSPLPPIPCPDEVDSQVSFPLWFIVAFNEASQGLLLFLLYGTSFRFFRTWYLLFTNPKALVSSKFAASSGDSSPAFTVEGRKVTSDGGVHSSNSKHMVDEIEGDESQWTTSETSSSDSSSRSDNDEDEEEGGDATNVEMEEIKS